MRLRAKVKKVLEPPANYIGDIADDQPVPVARLPNPDWLEISEEDGAFFLYYLNAELECFADSWHQSLDSAQHEAQIGFGITPDEWTEM